MTFPEVVMECFDNPDLMREYRRLKGGDFGLPKSPVDAMVDDATGFVDEQAKEFVQFVWDVVWCRIPPGD